MKADMDKYLESIDSNNFESQEQHNLRIEMFKKDYEVTTNPIGIKLKRK